MGTFCRSWDAFPLHNPHHGCDCHLNAKWRYGTFELWPKRKKHTSANQDVHDFTELSKQWWWRRPINFPQRFFFFKKQKIISKKQKALQKSRILPKSGRLTSLNFAILASTVFRELCPVAAMSTHLVVDDNSLNDGLVQHFLVPVLQSLGLGDLLFWRVTVENVVIPLWRRARPDVSHGVAQLLGILKVPNEDFMVHSSSQLTRPEEVNTVQVGDVDTSVTAHKQACQQGKPKKEENYILLTPSPPPPPPPPPVFHKVACVSTHKYQ